MPQVARLDTSPLSKWGITEPISNVRLPTEDCLVGVDWAEPKALVVNVGWGIRNSFLRTRIFGSSRTDLVTTSGGAAEDAMSGGPDKRVSRS